MKIFLAPDVPECIYRELGHAFRRYRGMGRTWAVALMRKPGLVTEDGERIQHEIKQAIFSVEVLQDGYLFTPTPESVPLIEAFARECGSWA